MIGSSTNNEQIIVNQPKPRNAAITPPTSKIAPAESQNIICSEYTERCCDENSLIKSLQKFSQLLLINL